MDLTKMSDRALVGHLKLAAFEVECGSCGDAAGSDLRYIQREILRRMELGSMHEESCE